MHVSLSLALDQVGYWIDCEVENSDYWLGIGGLLDWVEWLQVLVDYSLVVCYGYLEDYWWEFHSVIDGGNSD